MLENIVKRLRLLTESADRYVTDGAWLETLTQDIELAKQALLEFDDAYPIDEED